MNLLRYKQVSEQHLIQILNSTTVHANTVNAYLNRKGYPDLQQGCKLAELIMRPNVTILELAEILPELKQIISNIQRVPKEVIESTEINIKYQGYIKRERMTADKLQRLYGIRIPDNFDYKDIHSLSTEARQKLTKIQPKNIGEAIHIPGVSPNDINVLLVFMGR